MKKKFFLILLFTTFLSFSYCTKDDNECDEIRLYYLELIDKARNNADMQERLRLERDQKLIENNCR